MKFLRFPPLPSRLWRHPLGFFLGFLLLTLATAQQLSEGNIVGRIRVVRGDFPANNVMVVLQARGAQVDTVYTDGEGKFVFEGLLANVYHIVIQEKGYQPIDLAVNLDPSIQHVMYVYPELVPVEDQVKPVKTDKRPEGSNPAIVDLSALLSRFPKDAQKHYEKATDLQSKGKQSAAIEEYRKALAIAPDMYFARNNLGSLYLQGQQFANAEVEFRKVIETNHADANAYFNLANVCLLTKRLDEATASIQQGMARDPQSAFGHFLMGSVMLQKGNRPEAEKQLRAALDADPGMANAHLALVNLYLEEKRNSEAIEELHAFLRQDPDSGFAPHARELLKKLQTGSVPQ
jgi:Tfp pilus assembly protein PilF